ncbi:MAG: hypothetical protein DIU80_014065 [Chloroflexota bacterium]|nr:MAG: hypothetical protein DIU80_18680 [Chloroflexota bacterium]
MERRALGWGAGRGARPALRRLLGLALCACFVALASGCMLVSGERVNEDISPEAGNRSASFVSAEGEALHELRTGAPDAELRVIVILEAEQGELRLDLLDDGEVTLSARSRPDEQVTRSGTAATDSEGVLRYRVAARGARNGGYQILYQRQ